MVEGYLFRHFAPLLTLSLWGGMVLLPSVVHAEVPLSRAVIESLRNAVELNRQNQAPRSANVRDTLVPGDALLTARAALAELRFNDGSLARIGGQALFRFLAHTRTLQLSNGTLLLLVPPDRGQTHIQTPNAAASIRGSALFVRYLPETDVTLIGSLTDSGIEITNRDRSQTQPLRAGEIAVVVKDRIEQVYRFDLKTFYSTSELVRGLDLQRSASGDQTGAPPDQAIAAVRAETSAAANTQAPLEAVNVTTAAGGQSLDPRANASQGSQSLPSNASLEQATNAPGTIAPPASRLLLPSTVTLPTTFPSTVALPTNSPAGNPAAANGTTPPRVAVPPNIGGTPPGLAGTTPGQSGNTPGQGGLPPGQAGTVPGLAGTTPGQGGLPPGQAGTAPGLAGTTPGQAP